MSCDCVCDNVCVCLSCVWVGGWVIVRGGRLCGWVGVFVRWCQEMEIMVTIL